MKQEKDEKVNGLTEAIGVIYKGIRIPVALVGGDRIEEERS